MKKTKMDAEVDLELVKKINETKTWTSFCKICDKAISGTLSEIREHHKVHHGEESK